MKKHLLIAAAAMMFLSQAATAEANDWMFRRSWFSHRQAEGEPQMDAPRSRGAVRRAVPQRGPGFAVRGAYRYNVYRIQSGRSFDTTIYREFRYEETP